MWKDLIYSIRALRRSPLITVASVLSLALGIGANTAIFSLLNQVVIRSLPVHDPERLVVLHREYSPEGTSSSDNQESVFSFPIYREFRDRDPAFAGVIARMSGSVRVAKTGIVESAAAELVSGNFFQVLGVGTSLGRVIEPADDGAPGAHAVVVLSHGYWSKHFGKDPAILNQSIILNGHPFIVLGVTAPLFRGITPGQTPDIYVPIAMQRSILTTMDVLEDRSTRWLNLFGRLKPGMSIQQAQAASDVAYRAILQNELTQLGRMSSDRARDQFLNHRVELRFAAQGISELRKRGEKPLVALMTLVGFVLLIACANVASLMMARAAGRQREIAIRLAIGAGRMALVKQLLMEGLLLAISGGALALLVSYWCTEALVRLLPKDYANSLSAAIDLPLLMFTLGVSVVCGLVFGLIPALQSTRFDLAGTLKDQAKNVVSGHARLRQALVIGQLAMSLVLVVGAGLFAGSLRNLLNVDLGFRIQHLLLFNVNATPSRPGLGPAVALYDDLQSRVSTIPGVGGVGAAIGGPFSDSNRAGNITVEGYQARPDENTVAATVAVSSGFFRALDIPLRAGREFTARDDHAAPKVVVVNEAFGKRYFAGRSPIGRHLMFGASDRPVLDREIVGVVPDTRSNVRTPPKETVYFPYAQWARPDRLVFYVRSAGDHILLTDAIRGGVREADPSLPVVTTTPLDVKIRDTLYTERLIAILSQAFAVLATLLAAIGLYGVIAYTVTQRTAEIGIRMALGAVPGDVLGMILKGAGGMAAIGIGIGLAGALALSRVVESQLFGIRPADPSVLAGAAGTLAIVALIAAWVPGHRAARIDPLKALKHE